MNSLAEHWLYLFGALLAVALLVYLFRAMLGAQTDRPRQS